ncbi:MAG: hypothetical protein DWQ11_12240 [Proteobacteria bacterium]|nr:MAG: hypothetical protein DWQ11_12240 [Pseudomonadota bacterium]
MDQSAATVLPVRKRRTFHAHALQPDPIAPVPQPPIRLPGQIRWYYHLDDIRKHLKRHHPAMLGRHVREQIEALGLLDEFDGGTVLIQLPYTFT